MNKLKMQALINESKANEIKTTMDKIESNKKEILTSNSKSMNNYDENTTTTTSNNNNNNRKRKIPTQSEIQSKSTVNNSNTTTTTTTSSGGAVSSRFKTDICEHFLKDECHYNKPLCRYAHGFYDLHCPYPNGVAVKGYDIHKYKSKSVFEDLFQCDLKSTEIHKTFAFVFLEDAEDVDIILKFNNYSFRDIDDKEYTLEVFQPPMN